MFLIFFLGCILLGIKGTPGFMWLSSPDLNGFEGDLVKPFRSGDTLDLTITMQCPGASETATVEIVHWDELRNPLPKWNLGQIAVGGGYTGALCNSGSAGGTGKDVVNAVERRRKRAADCTSGAQVPMNGLTVPNLIESSFGYRIKVTSQCWTGVLPGPARGNNTNVAIGLPFQADQGTECRFYQDPDDESRRFISCEAFDAFATAGGPAEIVATTPFFGTPEFEIIKLDVQLPVSRLPDCHPPYPDQTTTTLMLTNSSRTARSAEQRAVVCGNLAFPDREDVAPFRCEKPDQPMADDRSVFIMASSGQSCPCLLVRGAVYPPTNDPPQPGDVHRIDVELLRVDANRLPGEQSLLNELPDKFIKLYGFLETPIRILPGRNCPGWVDPCRAGTRGCPCRSLAPACSEDNLVCSSAENKCIDPNGPTPAPPTRPTPAPPLPCNVVQTASCADVCGGDARVDRCDCSGGTAGATAHCKPPEQLGPEPQSVQLGPVLGGGLGAVFFVTFVGLVGFAFYRQKKAAEQGPNMAQLYDAADQELQSSPVAGASSRAVEVNAFGAAAPSKPSKAGKGAPGGFAAAASPARDSFTGAPSGYNNNVGGGGGLGAGGTVAGYGQAGYGEAGYYGEMGQDQGAYNGNYTVNSGYAGNGYDQGPAYNNAGGW